MKSASAVSGVATVTGRFVGKFSITVVPGTASGTGTVTVRPSPSPDVSTDFETLFDSDGVALTVDLSQQVSYNYDGKLTGVKVTSSNAADTFDLIVG